MRHETARRVLILAALAFAPRPALAQLAPIHIGTVVVALQQAASGVVTFQEAFETIDCAITGAGPVCASPMDDILGEYGGMAMITAWTCGAVPEPGPFPFGMTFQRAPGRLVRFAFDEAILDLDPVFLEPDTAYDPETGTVEIGPVSDSVVVLICTYEGDVTIDLTFDGFGAFGGDATVSVAFPPGVPLCLNLPPTCAFDANLGGGLLPG
ncbi:MAG: hypothetical protein KC466_20900 [Myxococcales bacterium]|nr:hypothetical protein [Myxococcales bacterium]